MSLSINTPVISLLKNKVFSADKSDASNLIEQLPHVSESSWVARHVSWLKQPRPSLLKVTVVALIILAVLILSLSLIGLPLAISGIKEWRKQLLTDRFNEWIKNRSPPLFEDIPLISLKTTFNHTNVYSIHDDVIWTKSFKEGSWKPIYFDGFAEGRLPVEVQADGANLVIKDDCGAIHYKKVLTEKRDKVDQHYIYKDISVQNNWKSAWFSLPIFHHIVNFFCGKRLQLTADTRSWAISHRGFFNHYQTDAVGVKHVEDVGTTSLFALIDNGERIQVYDPWVMKSTVIHFPLPNTSESTFEGIQISASCSTLMVIGYEVRKNPSGGLTKELKVYTWFVDVDVMGWNPGVRYDYPGNDPNQKSRVIPMPTWQEHPLPQQGTNYKSGIKIIQNGQGNNARFMVIAGEKEGVTGYFCKNITDPEWKFTEVLLEDYKIALDLPKQLVVEGEFIPKVFSYKGKVWNKGQKERLDVKLKQFGEGSYLSSLTLADGDEKVKLILNKRKTLWNFLNFNKHKYEIALPKADEICPKLQECLKKLFGTKKVIQVHVSEGDPLLKITAKDVSFIFKTKKEPKPAPMPTI